MKKNEEFNHLMIELNLGYLITDSDRVCADHLEKSLPKISDGIRCLILITSDDRGEERDTFFIFIPLSLSGAKIKEALKMLHDNKSLVIADAIFHL